MALAGCLAAGVLLASTSSGVAQQQPVKGEATFSAANGFARLVIKLDEDVESDVSVAGSILVIRFKRPVDIPVDGLSDAVPDYVGQARRDPDGEAIRLSLSRRVSINSMSAGERLFVDLLPDNWQGQPPALPQEVVRELAERARVAERALRMQRAADAAAKRPPVRVRASVQPTFVRFAFDLPDGAGVSSVLNEQKLSLQFNPALTFDLADAKLAAPASVASINQSVSGDTAAVSFGLIGDVDVHAFREDKSYIVDIGFQQADKSALPLIPPAAPAAAVAPPTSHAAAPVASPQAVATPPTPPAAVLAVVAEKPPVASPPLPKIAAEPIPKPEAARAVETKPEIAKVAVTAPPVPKAESQKLRAATPDAARSSPAVDVKRDSDGLGLTFSFDTPVPAAMFRRADAVWLIFDSATPIDVAPIRSAATAIVADVSAMPLEQGQAQAIRFRLRRPQLASLTANASSPDAPMARPSWTVQFADTVESPPQPLIALRNIVDRAHANVSIPLVGVGRLHRITDPDVGDTLTVITAAAPVRGFLKRQNFVEFSLLESLHGVVVQPNTDDVVAEVGPDQVMLRRPGGLTLSAAKSDAERAPAAVRPIFDPTEWQGNKGAGFLTRRDMLIDAAAEAPEQQRAAARLDVARFYLARGMYPEAKAVLDLVLMDADPGQLDPSALIVHAVASSLMGRPELALKDLANPAIGAGVDTELWKALALERQGKWAEAREKFKNVQFTVASLPLDLQRIVLTAAMRCSLEVKDYAGAAARSSDLDAAGLRADHPDVAVMRGRVAEAMGHDKDALDQYGIAIASTDRPAATEAKLFDIALRRKHDEINQDDALRDLETLAVTWRGDGLEVKTQAMLARIYSDTGRYADSLAAARTATRLQPNSDVSRQAQDDASALFAQIFLSPKGDDLPPVDALALFYEYRELTPIGRRGDEMIRRLADRLVAVDLLDQAAEILQYQVDHRLEGAARAQVASRLAMVYLMNRKPGRAIAALRSTRIADLAGELRQQRLLLEARAQSDVGRRDLALDIITNVGGREAIRLRSDIYWAARRWREASEQIELYYGDRWRDFKPLDATEKSDVVRAAVGYALAEDTIGMARFREKYAPLMREEADRALLDAASKPASADRGEFVKVAKIAASVDTLDGFLRDMKSRFPDATARAPLPPDTPKADPFPTGSLPQIVGVKQVDAAR